VDLHVLLTVVWFCIHVHVYKIKELVRAKCAYIEFWMHQSMRKTQELLKAQPRATLAS